jgi:hypothetical protein
MAPRGFGVLQFELSEGPKFASPSEVRVDGTALFEYQKEQTI